MRSIFRAFFWFLIGAVATALLVRRGKAMLHKVTPEGVAEQLQQKQNDWAAKASEFMSTMSEAAQAQEAHLRSELGMKQ